MRRSRSEVTQSIGAKAHGESWQGVESHSTTCAAYTDIFVRMTTTRMSSCTYHSPLSHSCIGMSGVSVPNTLNASTDPPLRTRPPLPMTCAVARWASRLKRSS